LAEAEDDDDDDDDGGGCDGFKSLSFRTTAPRASNERLMNAPSCVCVCLSIRREEKKKKNGGEKRKCAAPYHQDNIDFKGVNDGW